MHQIQIIAEVGVNHNGDIDVAKLLIEKASAAGADYVKFQTFCTHELTVLDAPQATYQKQTAGEYVSQYEMLKALELSYEAHSILKAYCRQCGIGFLSTPFDLKSLAFLDQFGIPFWKVPSGEITNYPYLVRMAKTGKRIILSTGMSTLQEIRDALQLLRSHGSGEVTLLHCNTQYPTPFEDANLNAIQTLRERFGVPVGYSDHTTGIEVSVAAAALGATVLEKHFTLDRTMMGPDHCASLEPNELAMMIRMIRNIEKALGSPVKQPSPSEIENIGTVRKSIVAARVIQVGEQFTEENLTTKRPGNGLSPMLWPKIIGQIAPRSFQADEAIQL